MPTGTPQSPALAPSPSCPARWGVSHPHLPEGACWGSPGVLMQVERERELHSRLRHPHIVRLHGHFADRGHVYLLLEFCSRGVSERRHPKTRPPPRRGFPRP